MRLNSAISAYIVAKLLASYYFKCASADIALAHKTSTQSQSSSFKQLLLFAREGLN